MLRLAQEETMRRVLLVTVAAVAVFGCAEQEPQPTPEQIAQQKVQQALSAGRMEEAAGPAVEVAAEGTRFDPPVQIDQLPADVWYCDMGTVHYARTEEGDGRCPECGMTLTHR
jgi:hypothetical protein